MRSSDKVAANKSNQFRKGYFMSPNDEMAARGRLITDYGDSKKRLAILEAEADRIGGSLQELGKMLATDSDSLFFRNQSVRDDYPSLPHFDSTLDEVSRIPALALDIRETKDKLKKLRPKLEALGLLEH
ncbi:MAG: hypothetical protein ABSC60_09140 [Acidobacteriota bacterium]|jgi:hypothetical protein